MGEPGDEIPDVERLVSAGCAIQNMLLVATAQGFGTSLTSGKAMDSTGLRELFALGPLEQAICFLNIGTPVLNKLPHVRPVPADFVSVLGERQ